MSESNTAKIVIVAPENFDNKKTYSLAITNKYNKNFTTRFYEPSTLNFKFDKIDNKGNLVAIVKYPLKNKEQKLKHPRITLFDGNIDESKEYKVKNLLNDDKHLTFVSPNNVDNESQIFVINLRSYANFKGAVDNYKLNFNPLEYEYWSEEQFNKYNKALKTLTEQTQKNINTEGKNGKSDNGDNKSKQQQNKSKQHNQQKNKSDQPDVKTDKQLHPNVPNLASSPTSDIAASQNSGKGPKKDSTNVPTNPNPPNTDTNSAPKEDNKNSDIQKTTKSDPKKDNKNSGNQKATNEENGKIDNVDNQNIQPKDQNNQPNADTGNQLHQNDTNPASSPISGIATLQNPGEDQNKDSALDPMNTLANPNLPNSDPNVLKIVHPGTFANGNFSVNGAFVNSKFYKAGEKITLENGKEYEIKPGFCNEKTGFAYYCAIFIFEKTEDVNLSGNAFDIQKNNFIHPIKFAKSTINNKKSTINNKIRANLKFGFGIISVLAAIACAACVALPLAGIVTAFALPFALSIALSCIAVGLLALGSTLIAKGIHDKLRISSKVNESQKHEKENYKYKTDNELDNELDNERDNSSKELNNSSNELNNSSNELNNSSNELNNSSNELNNSSNELNDSLKEKADVDKPPQEEVENKYKDI